MAILLKNNLIAIAIHLCLCVVLLYPLTFLLRTEGVVAVLSVTAYTIFVVLVYFISGKTILSNAGNSLIDILSVIVLAMLIIVITFTLYDSALEYIIRVPFYPIGVTISYFLHTKEMYVYLVMSLLPSLIMWIGLSSRRCISITRG
ncbi:MAG: hypothetical protein FWG40_01570 [Peptococcaceae bacterium]|nr:hypothetical protein [Peptococcaceae bacterium]